MPNGPSFLSCARAKNRQRKLLGQTVLRITVGFIGRGSNATVLCTGSRGTPNLYRYRGEQYDSDLNLYYLRARWYNPATGRFLSHDPLPGWLYEPATLHRYNYASTNPVNRIDPSGQDDFGETAEIDKNVSVASEAEEEAVGKEVECQLSIDASLLYAAIDYDWSGDETGVVQSLAMIMALPAQCTAENEIDEAKSCPFCFAAGTPVHTDHGDVPIEKIEVGNEVEARNSETGKLEKEPVTALTPIHKDNLLEIRVEGEQSPLRPSTHHPFWTQRGGEPAHWINSAQLRIGDRLLTIDGKWRAITAITPVAGEETVYNFTVDKDHDYFVGETGFLVHNAGGCGCKFIGTPLGQLIAVPLGYVAMTALNGKGLILAPAGQPLGDNSNIIRWGEPSPQNPNGYFRYYNGNGQPLNPLTGKSGSNPETHIEPDCPGPWKGLP